MLTYTKTPDSNVAEIVVDGKITDEEMNAAMTAMKADLDKAGGVREVSYKKLCGSTSMATRTLPRTFGPRAIQARR